MRLTHTRTVLLALACAFALPACAGTEEPVSPPRDQSADLLATDTDTDTDTDEVEPLDLPPAFLDTTDRAYAGRRAAELLDGRRPTSTPGRWRLLADLLREIPCPMVKRFLDERAGRGDADARVLRGMMARWERDSDESGFAVEVAAAQADGSVHALVVGMMVTSRDGYVTAIADGLSTEQCRRILPWLILQRELGKCMVGGGYESQFLREEMNRRLDAAIEQARLPHRRPPRR